MAIGSTLFAVMVWGSIGSVLVAFGYISWLLVALRREEERFRTNGHCVTSYLNVVSTT